MGLTIKIGLLLIFVAVAALIVFSAFSYLRPVATTAWLRRIALRRAGLRKTKMATSAGEQIVWHGGDGPLLVLLHGAGDQAGTWNSVAPELKRHFRLVLPDLAGHGESEPHHGVLSLGTVLSALEQVLDANAWSSAPLVIAGNSLGAWVAMLYAEKHPLRVTRVILIDGGPIRSASAIDIMPMNREEARQTLDKVTDPSSPRAPNFVLDDLVRVSNSGPISRLMAAGEEDMSKYLLEDKLASFQAPVDVIWGGSDRLVPVDYAKKLQTLLPQCSLTVIERCGHAPQRERPRELTRVLLKILAVGLAHGHAAAQSATTHAGEDS